MPLLPFIGRDQTLQIIMVRRTKPFDVNNEPLLCDVTLEVSGTSLVGSLATGPLQPGQAATLSVNFNALNLRLGDSAFLGLSVIARPIDIVMPNESTLTVSTASGCRLSYQVVDNFSQWTTTIATPQPPD